MRTCRVTVPDLNSGWTDCAQIWYTDRDQLVGRRESQLEDLYAVPIRITRGSKGGLTWVMIPLAARGHHWPGRGTAGLSGAPQACQEHYRHKKSITGLPGAPQTCQGHQRPARGTTCLSGVLQACQEHHSRVSAQGHQRPVRGTSGLLGPRGTTVLPGATQACQGH